MRDKPLSEVPYEALQKEMEFRRRTKHRHSAFWENGILIDTCLYCGLDLRNDVHEWHMSEEEKKKYANA